MNGGDVRSLLSRNIKDLRSHRDLSQAALAERSDISVPFLGAIERGDKWPHPDTLARLADALGVEIAALFSRESPAARDVTAVVSRLTRGIAALVNESVEQLNKIAQV